VPPHVVGLTYGGQVLDFTFLLDTKLGVIHWHECPFEDRYGSTREPILEDAEEWTPENEHEWRMDGEVWAVADFFEVLKENFCTLRFIPLSPTKVIFARHVYRISDYGYISMVQEIYRAHGWPDLEQYRKDECLAAVKKALDENYPDIIQNLW
jgi:hypothetical protein